MTIGFAPTLFTPFSLGHSNHDPKLPGYRPTGQRCVNPSPLGEGHARVVTQLMDLYQKEGLKVLVLSPSFVYGQGGLFKMSFYDTLKKGQFRVFSKGQNYWSPIQVDDLASAFGLALMHGQYGEVHHIVDDTPLPLRQLIDLFTSAQGGQVGGQYSPLVTRLADWWAINEVADQLVPGQ